MKKVLFFSLSLIAAVLVSCNQNNPNDPTNPTDPTNPDPTGSTEPEVKKVKYVVESGSWYTFQDSTRGASWSTPLNVVSKTVYERGSEAKYIKSISSYIGDELVSKYVYQNESDRDYRWQVYPEENGSSRDTTIWYDDARTKVKEQRGGYYRYIYGYDNQHNDRQVYCYCKSYYDNGNFRSRIEAEYTYSGLIRNGESKFYYSDTLYSIIKTIDEFRDDTYTQITSSSSETYLYPSKTIQSKSKLEYEWDGDLLTKYRNHYEGYDQNGNLQSNTRYVCIYTWQDELNNTSTTEYYFDNTLRYRESGYTKYTY